MITYNAQISVKDYNEMRKAVGWKILDEKQAETGLKNSAYLVAAWDDDKPIGMARAVSDGGYMVLIADVMVLPDYQGKGIGRKLIEKTNQWLDGLGKDGSCIMVNLMATPGNEPFYEKLGFTLRPNDHMGAGMVRWING